MDSGLIGGIAIGGIIALGSVILGLLFGSGISDDKVDALKQEAVKRGYAKWVVDEKGYTTFEWI